MSHNFRQRIRRVIKALKDSGGSNALVLSSNPTVTRSADQHYPYRANSDLYYLTGCTSPDLTLVVRDRATPQVVLVVPVEDPVRVVWEGKVSSIAPQARAIGASVVRTKDPRRTVSELLKGVRSVLTQSIPGTTSNEIRQDFARRQGETPRNVPTAVGNADSIISGLRLTKDRSEIKAIKEAGAVTGEALHAVVPLLTPGTQEREVAAMIDHLYQVRGGTPAFGTIVATGVSAATLHYHRLDRAIRNGDFVLIDTGVELGMYASDVTRTIPVGEISEAQATIYEAVLAAQRAAIKKIRSNVLIRDLYLAAAREITLGLKEVGVLKGTIATLIKKEAFKRYFPHGIGHSLGIDVHDVGGLRGTQDATLSEGVVFTIEPGVYLPKPTKHLPVLGIRIEDDVLVGRSGSTVLTDKVFPKELSQVAELLAKTARF